MVLEECLAQTGGRVAPYFNHLDGKESSGETGESESGEKGRDERSD
jgi:hypothetical protein